MSLFSERAGFKKVRTELQVEDIDKALQNSLWSALKTNIFDRLRDWSHYSKDNRFSHYKDALIENLWLYFYKMPIDTKPNSKREFVKSIRGWFFDAEWFKIYDFIEFVIEYHKDKKGVQLFVEETNEVLKRELSAYRIISSKITPITSEINIEEIQKASETKIKEVNQHINRALELLSDRKKPDYRNSIKESISAVETICKVIAGDTKATLGDALSKLEKQKEINFHGALKSAFQNIYGYTNDADGIRHSLMEESKLDLEDALFMISSCSSFINFLLVKMQKAKIKF